MKSKHVFLRPHLDRTIRQVREYLASDVRNGRTDEAEAHRYILRVLRAERKGGANVRDDFLLF